MRMWQRVARCFLAGALLLACCAPQAAAQSEAAMARAGAPAPTGQHDGQHDFDFELGAWNIHLKRRLHPLTGSTAWTERVLPWNERIQTFLFWVPIFLFPGIVVCAGAFVYFVRRC